MASYQLPFPRPMSCAGDMALNWQLFRESYEDYVIASELSRKEGLVQVATLKTVMGDECKKVLRRLNVSETDMCDPVKILDALQTYFVPERNILYERYVFHSADQADNESVDQYFIRLRQLAEPCRFLTMEDEMVRDRIVLGCKDRSARARLFRAKDVDLHMALDSLRVSEATHEQLRLMGGEHEPVHKIADQVLCGSELGTNTTHKVSYKRVTGDVSKIACKYCGGTHARKKELCPAYGKKCNKCGLLNHFQAVCRQRQYRERKHPVHKAGTDSESDSEVLLSTEVIGSVGAQGKRQFFVDLHLGGKKSGRTRCQIDTGATCNVLSYGGYCDIMQHGAPSMRHTNAKLKLYDGSLVSAIGECDLRCYLPQRVVDMNFKIVSGTQVPLLSGETCVDLGLVTIHPINKLGDISSYDNIITEFADVFNDELGTLPGVYHIEVDSKINPVQHCPRRVPVALKERVIKKLSELEAKGIIKKVTRATPWISSMVAVAKPNKLRICIDPKDLNRAILRPKYQMPTLDEVLPKLANAKVFTVLDAKDGFHQVSLDEPSSYLTTFWTPTGRYRYLRMPFGISSAPEEYQRRLHEAFADVPGTEVIVDDLLIFGCGDTEEEYLADHNKNLRSALTRARKVNLKLNIKKLRLRLTEVAYMGNLLTNEGLKPDPFKVVAIKEMPRPENKEAVQRFLGCVTYLSRFLPGLSQVSEPLRRLTDVSVLFHWQDQQEQAFQMLRQMLTTAPVLRYYDVECAVTIQCDASEKGLGAALLQNGQPVAFASRALTRTEIYYAQIEKECLAILFACTRFAQYLLGRDLITVETDHKPLVPIFKKDLHNAPKRLQRMLLSLQRFTLQVIYKPGREMHIADMLSRAYLLGKEACSNSTPEYQIFQLQKEDAVCHEVESVNQTDYLRMSAAGQQQTRTLTQTDPVLQSLLTTVLAGWPEVRDEVPIGIRDYWLFRDEITASDGILFKGQKVIIPKAMRPQVLERVHSSHLGLEACIRRARDVVFWPGMNAEIKDRINNCTACHEFLQKQRPEPLMSYPLPNRPWEMVGQDLFTYQNEDYLLTVDYFSDFWEVDLLHGTTSEAVIACSKSHFARHGIPEKVVTDGGPQFRSGCFDKFARDWEFLHLTSSPYHSQSNGKAESAVKIAKNLIKKAKRGGEDVQLAILDWRNTPNKDDGFSPAQKLMSRRTRSLLPTPGALLLPAPVTGIKEHILLRKQRAKCEYDKHARVLPDLHIGETVRLQPQEPKQAWKKAVCTGMVAPRSYHIQTSDGRTFRRNRRFLRSTSEDSGQAKMDGVVTQPYVDQGDPATYTPTAPSGAEDMRDGDTLGSGVPLAADGDTLGSGVPLVADRRISKREVRLPSRFKDFAM